MTAPTYSPPRLSVAAWVEVPTPANPLCPEGAAHPDEGDTHRGGPTVQPIDLTDDLPPPLPARDHELTAVLHRDVFDRLPDDVTDPEAIARWHSFRAQYHAAARLEHQAPFPLQVDFELNSTCQLACSFCTHGRKRVAKRLLPWDLYEKAIREGEAYGLASVKFNYINEPLLRRDLPEYIRFAREHGVINAYFATNGLLLTEEMAGRLIDAGATKIMVSLDAATPATYQAMRNSGQFDRIVANIRSLLALRERRGLDFPLVRVNFLQTRQNLHERETFLAQWEGVADSIGLQVQVNVPGQEDNLLPAPQDEGDFRCAFPFKLLVVDAAGAILPCCTFSGRLMPLGNLATMTLKEAWDHPAHQALQDVHLNGNWQENAVCHACVGRG